MGFVKMMTWRETEQGVAEHEQRKKVLQCSLVWPNGQEGHAGCTQRSTGVEGRK